jgi:lysophospholipase L1-like esterase
MPFAVAISPLAAADDMRYLALGDSYTIGQSVAERARWPIQLAKTLREGGVAVGEPEIIARTGWTGGELISAIEYYSPMPAYDLVSLLIGVNNQYRGRSPESFRPEFTALLNSAIKFARGRVDRVVVVSIPDYGFTPFGTPRRGSISRGIDEFNAVCRELTLAVGATFIDITPISRSEDPTLVARDGLHPSGSQYAAWVAKIAPAVERALAAP